VSVLEGFTVTAEMLVVEVLSALSSYWPPLLDWYWQL